LYEEEFGYQISAPFAMGEPELKWMETRASASAAAAMSTRLDRSALVFSEGRVSVVRVMTTRTPS
jgi:hypothetical protein